MKTAGAYVRSFFSMAGNAVPSPLLYLPSKKIVLPAYHVVSDQPLPHIHNLYKYRDRKAFIQDLDYLLKHFIPVDLARLIELSHSGAKINKNYFHLTFDDGLRECSEVILPILQRKGIPATFFINSAFVDNRQLMHRYKVSLMIEDLKNNDQKKQKVVNFIKRKLGIRRDASNFLLTLRYSHQRFMDEIALLTETDFQDFLDKHKPYLEKEQIRKMISEGFTFGAHSIDHPEYFMLKEEEQLRQTQASIHYMLAEFNLAYSVFAFPFTDHKVSVNFFNTILGSSHPVADLTFGVAGLKEDVHPHHLQRIPMEKSFSGKEVIKGEFLYYYFKSLIRKNSIKRD